MKIMSYYGEESSNGETRNYPNRWRRKEIYTKIANGILIDDNARNRAQEHFQEYGKLKYTDEGYKDRLDKYCPYNPNKYSSESDQKSYHGGFFNTGSLKVNAYLEFHPEEAIEYGKCDCERGITYQYLGPLVNNQAYMNGYNERLNERLSKGMTDEEIRKVGRYAFEVGMKKDNLGPLLNNHAFIQGYNDAAVDSIFALVEEARPVKPRRR